MRFRASICFLVISCCLRLFVQCRRTSNDQCDCKEMIRWQREKDFMPKGLKVRSSNGELIELTNEEPPEGTRRFISLEVTFFQLYTKKNTMEYQELTYDTASSLADLKRSNFDETKPTFFVTHGWTNWGGSPACTEVRDALLEGYDVNVIVVDWSSMSQQFYTVAVMYVPKVGKRVAEMIEFLVKNTRMSLDNTTLVGHSLGAHVVGLAGYHTHGLVDTIVGLDPALPLFAFAERGSRISSTDGKNVQIIHTNGGLLGYMKAIGTADFYPDGGQQQKNCFLDLGGACSHFRAFEYYAESLNSKVGFYGQRCFPDDMDAEKNYYAGKCKDPSLGRMGGFPIESKSRGQFYLRANQGSPFAKGKPF